MFANIKNRFISVMASDLPPLPAPNDYRNLIGSGGRDANVGSSKDKFPYARPYFLQLLTPDELKASADHHVRPIIVPRDIALLPFYTGYAECVNSGKSEWNEDQAAFCRQFLSDPTHQYPDVPYIYFGIFDGHASYGAALAASHQFHHILHEKLVDCLDMLLPRDNDSTEIKTAGNGFPHPSHLMKTISKDDLIVGALESAFFHMDSLIAQDRDRYRDAGGCTACVTLFINGKMFVANAGDSRAVLCLRNAKVSKEVITKCTDFSANSNESKEFTVYHTPFSFDHTPETERHRLLNVARLKPHLLGKYYAAMEYAKRPHVKDLGQRILCRQGTMKGWTYKTLTRDDLRMPVVTGEGKRSRLLGTLGVTRGFGDHDLLAITTGTQIKPFLTPQPDVKIRDLTKIPFFDEKNEDGDYGVLVIATDGLWDVSENEAVARTVFQTIEKYPQEKHRYTMTAQELVAKARGKINNSGHWRLADSKAAATVDDISVFVIPVYHYYKEFMEWDSKCVQEHQERLKARTADQQAMEAKELENSVDHKYAFSIEKAKALVVEESGEEQSLSNEAFASDNYCSQTNVQDTTEHSSDNKLSNVLVEPTFESLAIANVLNEATQILPANNSIEDQPQLQTTIIGNDNSSNILHIANKEQDLTQPFKSPSKSSSTKSKQHTQSQQQRNRNRKDNKR